MLGRNESRRALDAQAQGDLLAERMYQWNRHGKDQIVATVALGRRRRETTVVHYHHGFGFGGAQYNCIVRGRRIQCGNK